MANAMVDLWVRKDGTQGWVAGQKGATAAQFTLAYHKSDWRNPKILFLYPDSFIQSDFWNTLACAIGPIYDFPSVVSNHHDHSAQGQLTGACGPSHCSVSYSGARLSNIVPNIATNIVPGCELLFVMEYSWQYMYILDPGCWGKSLEGGKRQCPRWSGRSIWGSKDLG